MSKHRVAEGHGNRNVQINDKNTDKHRVEAQTWTFDGTVIYNNKYKDQVIMIKDNGSSNDVIHYKPVTK
jgi:hypothetical protein